MQKNIILILFCLIFLNISYGQELDINEELLWACKNSEFDEVKRLISLGADVNYINPVHGAKPLTTAITSYSPSRSIINYLIDKGAKINYKEGERTPLMCAVYIGFNDIVNKLINKGANINAKDEFGNTALFMACDGYFPKYQSAYINIVKLLIKFGAEVNLVSSNFYTYSGYTPLLLASKNGYSKILIELINAGADVNFKDKENKNALILSIEEASHSNDKINFDYMETIKILIKNMEDINEKDKNGNTALNYINNKIEEGYGYEEDQLLYSSLKKILIEAGAK